MSEIKKGVFETLFHLDVNDHVEKKPSGNGNSLSYLSWAWAWAELKKRYPDISYEIERFNGLPYVYDPATGYMVYTSMTIDGVTHKMWLPVMDGANRAMKAEPYEIKGKYNTQTVQAATMFDVNKTIMRCLVKNAAMFGLGLYIYSGEDIPEDMDAGDATSPKNTPVPTNATNSKPQERMGLKAAVEAQSGWKFTEAYSAFIKKHGIDGGTFAMLRNSAIASGLAEDVSSADMTKEKAEQLFKIIEENFIEE